MTLFINKKDQKILTLLMLANSILIMTSKADKEAVVKETKVKTQKLMKEYIALKDKAIKLNQDWFLNKSYVPKVQKKVLAKTKKKALKELDNVLKVYEKVKERKGYGDAIIELDYVPYLILYHLVYDYNINDDEIVKSLYTLTKLAKHKMSGVNEMDLDSDEIVLFKNSIKLLVDNIMED